jgi:hypothetical protein
MPDLPTILLIFGGAFLLVVITRRTIRKQKARAGTPAKPLQPQVPAVKPKMTQEQFNKAWKNLSYLMLLAGVGNLYVAYTAVGDALQSTINTETIIRYSDAVFAVAAAVLAVVVFASPRKKWVFAYLIITVIPIMFFMSTGHYTDAIVHLFPLILVYFVVQPVWSFIKE